MYSFDYIRTKLNNIAPNLSDSDLKNLIRSNLQYRIERIDSIASLDAAKTLFQLSFRPVQDNSLSVFRSSNFEGLESVSNLIATEYFDLENPSFVQAQPVAIDYSSGQLKLLTPYDLETEFILFKYPSIDVDAVIKSVIISESLTEEGRIVSERRGNVETSFKSLLGTYKDLLALEGKAGEIEVGNLTRLTSGREYGEI